MSLQTEKWNVILSAFDGVQTSRDSDDIPDGKSPMLINGRISGSHFRGATGYEIIGSRDATPGSITSKFTYNRNDGTQVMVRVKDDAATGVLQWYDATNDEWYTLIAGLTTGKRMGYAEFNTSTTNQMIFCNGVQNMSVWTGAITRLTAAALGASDTLDVEDTSNFPATGTIMYNGTEKAYDSKTATSFHATAGNWHASAGANDGVAQAADDSTHSAVTKGNILLSAKDRLWIAGQPSAPNALDYSDEGDAFVFTGGANRADSGTEDFYNIGGSITGLSEKGEEIIVLGRDGGDGFSFTYPTSTTKAPKFREIFRMPDSGCTTHTSIFKINQEVYFATPNGIQALGDLEGSDKVFTSSMTRDIQPDLKEFNFDEAASTYYEKENILLMACKTDEAFPGNDIVIGIEFYQDKEGNDRFGIVYLDWPVECWAIFNGFLHFGSSYEMNSFKAFSTYQHDGSPRTIKYATKRFNFRDPFQKKGSSYVAVRGYIKDGTDIDVLIQYNSGFLGTSNKTIESSGDYVSNVTLNTIGSFALGLNPIGALASEVSELKQFVVYLDVGVDYDFQDIDMLFRSDTDGGTFMITHVGLTLDAEGYAIEDHLSI
jgi:hypothetical protein